MTTIETFKEKLIANTKNGTLEWRQHTHLQEGAYLSHKAHDKNYQTQVFKNDAEGSELQLHVMQISAQGKSMPLYIENPLTTPELYDVAKESATKTFEKDLSDVMKSIGKIEAVEMIVSPNDLKGKKVKAKA